MRWAEDYHLFVIGLFALAAASIGYWHRRLHRPGDRIHISGMGVSYIALLTAFYVDNGKNLPLGKDLPPITYWLVPSVIGLPLVARALARAHSPKAPRATAVAPQRSN